MGTCDAEEGCATTALQGFASVRCRLGDLGTTIETEGVDAVARKALGKLLQAAGRKIDVAESGHDAGARGKTKRGFKVGRKKLLKFAKKVFKLQPKHVTDPAVGAALDGKAKDAVERVERLRQELGA
jgi:hypothetical protein